tara:strand:+ start:696 stop:1082 length:387 start_codon:yes stop_codon:yes gene_type:complete
MSTLEVSNLNDGTTTVATTFVTNGSAKAWAMADMDGDDAIEDSFNFASVTDNGTGDYEFNFTNSMSSASYAKSGNNGNKAKRTDSVTINRPAVSTSSAYKFTSLFATSSSEGAYDADDISAVIHGDLA